MISEEQHENVTRAVRNALNDVSHGLKIVDEVLAEARFKKANKFTELATRATLEIYQDQLNISKIALSVILRDISDDRKYKAERKFSTVG